MATSYRFCAFCKTIWVPNGINICAECNTPGVTDDVTVAYCESCDVAWHPRASLACWLCERPGIFRKEIRAWEQEPGTALVIHTGLFPAGAPV